MTTPTNTKPGLLRGTFPIWEATSAAHQAGLFVLTEIP